MQNVPQLVLDSKKARHFDGRHPWVLANSIVKPTVDLEAGEIVELVQPNGSWIGRGIYNPNSRVRLRLLQWSPDEELCENWVYRQLEQAVNLREHWTCRQGELEALRLVNSEGDGLSGLVVDRFSSFLVVQFTSLAMLRWKDAILSWLQERLAPDNIHFSLDASAAKLEGVESFQEWTGETPERAIVNFQDKGVALTVDLSDSQKTGYYLDQRSNRERAAASFVPGSLLDVCCYHGGFSLAACKQGSVSDVTALDSSEKALRVAKLNAEQNKLANITFLKADCFDHLQQLCQQGQKFDNIVLDPPRMASHRSQLNSALRAYYRLNLSAVNLLRPGGMLVSCSCSGRVLREDFWGVLSSVAKRSRRRIQLLEGRGADFDHTIDVNCPESDYLKCFICRVC
ncbi:MAG: class I SAM-dependent rRNA methyltransferase [Planctomycetota bacterium]